jgi:triacylglycerol lipase
MGVTRMSRLRRWVAWVRPVVVAGAMGVLAAGAPAAQVALPDWRPPASAGVAAPDTREVVVLVHGMGRSPVSMWVLARRLERDGYRVVRFGYRSTRGTVAEHGAALARRASLAAGDAPRVHFVGHSLGGIIIRSMLATAPPERIGRVVMLAPPNQGSTAADRWTRWLGWAMPHIRELRTDPRSTARTLSLPAGVDVGIIAGSRDRKVRVAETRLDGARDHAVVPGFHSWLMNRPDVHRLIREFLRDGRFSAPVRVDAGAA